PGWRSLGKWIGKAITISWVHKHPYPSSLALKGFFAQSQTHLIAAAAGAAIVFAVPLHPNNALALSMLAHAVSSELTAADAWQKHDRSRLSTTAMHVTGDNSGSARGESPHIDVAELLKVAEVCHDAPRQSRQQARRWIRTPAHPEGNGRPFARQPIVAGPGPDAGRRPTLREIRPLRSLCRRNLGPVDKSSSSPVDEREVGAGMMRQPS